MYFSTTSSLSTTSTEGPQYWLFSLPLAIYPLLIYGCKPVVNPTAQLASCMPRFEKLRIVCDTAAPFLSAHEAQHLNVNSLNQPTIMQVPPRRLTKHHGISIFIAQGCPPFVVRTSIKSIAALHLDFSIYKNPPPPCSQSLSSLYNTFSPVEIILLPPGYHQPVLPFLPPLRYGHVTLYAPPHPPPSLLLPISESPSTNWSCSTVIYERHVMYSDIRSNEKTITFALPFSLSLSRIVPPSHPSDRKPLCKTAGALLPPPPCCSLGSRWLRSCFCVTVLGQQE